MFITTARITKTGLRNFIRNAWLSTAATAVMTVTLTLVAVSYISNAALTSTIKSVVDKIDVSVYLKDSDTPEQIKAFQSKLQQVPNVTTVTLITKADALKAYRKENAGNQKLLDAISESDNPLPASLQVKVKDQNQLGPVSSVFNQPESKALIQDHDGISYSGDRKATIDRIIKTSNFFKTTGLVASLMFVVISTLIIFNTIRMAIFTRREEIEIMKLVGATGWFIRGPFIFEAALYGIIAAVIALVIIYSVVLGFAPKLNSYIDTASIIHFLRSNIILVILIELLIGVSIGGLSSVFALKRYLKL